MTNKGHITVKGSQQDGTDWIQTAAVATAAEYYARDGAHYIFYKEIPENADGTIKNYIKFRDGLLELTRKGSVRTHMVFQPGREHPAPYSTPFGTLTLGILTDTLESHFHGNTLQICAVYALTDQGSIISKNKIHIKMVLED